MSVLTMLDFRSKEDLSNDVNSGAALLTDGAWTTLGEALNHGCSHLVHGDLCMQPEEFC